MVAYITGIIGYFTQMINGQAALIPFAVDRKPRFTGSDHSFWSSHFDINRQKPPMPVCPFDPEIKGFAIAV